MVTELNKGLYKQTVQNMRSCVVGHSPWELDNFCDV